MRSTFFGGLGRFFPPAIERREPDAATQAWRKHCDQRQAARDAQRSRLKASRPPRDDSAIQAALQQIETMKIAPRDGAQPRRPGRL